MLKKGGQRMKKNVPFGKRKIIAFFFVLIIIFLFLFSAQTINVIKKAFSDFIVISLQDYQKQKIGDITFHFKKEDEKFIGEVSHITKEAMEKVNQNFEEQGSNTFHVVIYPNFMEMKKGLKLSSEGSTLGGYYGGNLFVLSPEQLKKKNSSLENIFLHEYTHLLVEKRTKGNHPVWFTEGIALYQEYIVTGYEWGKDAPYRKNPYCLDQLENEFYQLDTFEAYRSSFLRIRFLAERYGEKTLLKIMEQLGQGKDFQNALEMTLRKENNILENEFRLWYHDNFYGKL